MTKLTLLFRNLRYFRGVNLAVLLGMAVATAVLTGALMVGDSVRGSLADLALRRLGPVDYALISTRFFPQTLAGDLGPDVAPAIIVRGGAMNNSDSFPGEKPHTADVQIAALGGSALGKGPFNFPAYPSRSTDCLINAELAEALGVKSDAGGKGDSAELRFTVPRDADMPREAALAQRNSYDALNSLSATATLVHREQDFLSLFSPAGSQRVQRNAWVTLGELQRQVNPDDSPETPRVNVLLAHANDATANPDDAVKMLNSRISDIAQGKVKGTKTDGLGLYGLSVRDVGNQEVSLFSNETYFAPPAVRAAEEAAGELKIPLREVSANLITRITNVSAGKVQRTIHNSVGAGISSLTTKSGAEYKLNENEVAINEWTAAQLGAHEGDELRIDFLVRGSDGNLVDTDPEAAHYVPTPKKAGPKKRPGKPNTTPATAAVASLSETIAASDAKLGKGVISTERLTFIVKHILPMNGLGADRDLPPVYKGLTDKGPAHWDPPAGLKEKIHTELSDEPYWDQYGLSPKVYVSFATAQKLWGGVYGEVTGLRVPRQDKSRFVEQFLAKTKPESMGMVFRPIKAEQLAAANGGTDFGEFFLMFSFFLIVAAALLVAMLFRLNVEQRARQLGLMSAVGISPGALRRLALAEGMILAVIGSVIGLGGAILYTSLIMFGLRTFWIDAVGTTSMTLHIVPLTLVYGWVGGLFVAFFAILWAVWRVGKAQPARLLAGGWGTAIRRRGSGHWLRWIGISAIAIGLVMVGIALTGKISAVTGFGGGSLLLCGCLAMLGADLRARRHPGASFAGPASLIRLGIRNASRHTARGVLSVGLIGFAAFTLITVAALKENGVKDPVDRTSGTGGYRLILSAGIPLSTDLNTEKGRELDGMTTPEAKDAIYADARFTMVRLWAGQDVSCLNLTKPNSPTILGLPPEMIQRGGFGPPGDKKNWELLNSDQSKDIPVIADSDTAEYVLKVSTGDTIPIADQLGVPRNLKLVALIPHTIFQGQLLMSDANFRKLFPAQNGFGMALVDPKDGAAWPPGKDVDIARHLGGALSNYSVSVDTAAARLQTYQNVQNTYLETFQTLGALGLMLGTLGLAVVLVRTVIERKAELALLASLGFASAARVTLVLAENAFLLILGLAMGAVSAVIGILPTVIHDARHINVFTLVLTLAAVLVIGLLSSAAAVGISGVHVKPADLRRE